MPFERLRLRNVRCFRETEIRLHEKLTVIVGGNATGKTTMMEVLASVTHGDDEGLSGFPLRHGAQHGEVSVYEANGNQSVARWRSGEKGRRRLPSGRYAFLYGRYRCISAPGWDSEDRGLTDAEYLDELASHAAKSRTATLTHPDNRLMNDLDGYLRGLNFGRGSDSRLETMWCRLVDSLRN